MRPQTNLEKSHNAAVNFLRNQDRGGQGPRGISGQQLRQFTGVFIRVRIRPKRLAQRQQLLAIAEFSLPQYECPHGTILVAFRRKRV